MSGFKSINFANDTITKLASGTLMVSSPSILFDGKILDADNAELWQNSGTGTFTFTGNKVNMSVTAGQYCIRQSKRVIPYFSGYPLIVEETFDNFDIQADGVKRVGYFNSTAVSPFQTNYDGFWLEMDGTTYRLKAARSGTETVNVPFASWDNYALLSGYNFNNFTAIFFDFLWLGGAALRIWVCTPDKGWVLGHSAQYIGNFQDTICTTPNHSLRYEVISTTGILDMRYICSQASVLGDVGNLGYTRHSINTTTIACNSVGTIYALQGLKKNATYRDIAVKFQEISCVNVATNDTGLLLLLRNPTLSAPLTYAAYGKVNRAVATTQTVVATGEIIEAQTSGQTGGGLVNNNYRSWLTQNIDDTFDEYVLAYLSASNNQDLRGILTYKEF